MKDETKTLTPKLRFPEFRDEPGWEERPLEAFLSPIVREKEKPSGPYTGLGVRSHGKGTFLKPFEAPENNSMEYLYEVHADDLIVNITFAWEGAIAIAQATDTGALVSHRFPTYRFNEDLATPEFFRYSIVDEKLIYQLGVISPGGAGRNRVLNKRDFLQLTRFVPTPAEQRKIAACLTSLDKLIAAESRKLEAQQIHRKGLIQQLLPWNGELRPSLRFPEFRDGPEWIAAPFDKLYTFAPTNTLSRAELSYSEGTIKNIHYGDIHTKFAATFRIQKERVPYIGPGALLGKIKQEAFCREGDMVFADSSEDLVDVGKSIEIVDLNGEQVLSGSHTILARRLDESLVVGFGAYLFKSREVRAQIEKEAQGTKVMAISPSRLAGINVRYPSNRGEQRQIACCLSSLDALVAAQSRKLDGLRAHKKGLMQQLFPSPEGV